MKIIATVKEGEYLVEASSNELARIMGLNSCYEIRNSNRPALGVGSEIDVSAHWDALGVARSRTSNIKGQAQALRTLADKIDAVNVVFNGDTP